MNTYKEITAIMPREPEYPWRYVCLPRLTLSPYGSKEHDDWTEKNWWMVDYSVLKDDKPRAVQLALELDQLFKNDPNDPKITRIVEELRLLNKPKCNVMTPVDQWTNSAYGLASYCGVPAVFEIITKQLAKYQGKILEAMCGHTSYFESGDVIALDYCEASLERYTYPHRRRICCDLNEITDGETLSFFDDQTFDVVSVCFGFKYPDDIESLAMEFLRILKPGGILSFIENPTYHYYNLMRRPFDPETANRILSERGFQKVTASMIPTPFLIAHDDDRFWHVEAIK